MKAKPLIFVLLLSTLAIIPSCSTNKALIEKEKSDYGTVQFYTEKNSKDTLENQRLLASVDNKIFYSFYPDRIVKKTKENKGLIYTTDFKELPASFVNNTQAFKKLTATDSLIFSKGSKILDSLGWTNHKRPLEASGFLIEVQYYHGYPKGKKFRPFSEM